ncbi:aspartate-alanine antiporter [Glycomyces algeriensis]|uniref:Transporter n=1 Tax=Glycomyces algeriensis TaxID=256037 RepID=A0A9W6LHR7_9ACTN|nr:aspartate-alanine antiporter [Glycomyces algeriensis]MDA1365459.1 aspartate-alanine antiporter [Glycomyces algeriensis]MDR7351145.1 putative transport protein [Glycomyces algeriensis]GLI43858.1 putative transporter [Glycomyces algeriensis]
MEVAVWDWLSDALVAHPEIAIFLALGLGFFVGKFKIKGIALGPVTGTLLAGVLVGILFAGLDIPDLVKTVAFVAFLFALGYNVGPQFFAGLRGDGVKQVVLAVINCVFGLVVVIVLAKLLGYGPGWGAGLLAGGLTQSAVIGVADSAISALPGLSADEVKELESQVAVGYAVCYLFGTAAAAFFLSTIAPKMLGSKDLAADAHEMEQRLGVAKEPGIGKAYYSVVRRAYRIHDDAATGRTVGELEARALELGHRVMFHDLRRDGRVLPVQRSTALEPGDVVTLAARRPDLVALDLDRWTEEVDDEELLSYSIETLAIVITKKALVGMSIGDAFAAHAPRLFVTKVVRGGQELPWSDATEIHRGDEITVQGGKEEVEAVIGDLGYPNRSSDATDMSYVGMGIVLGCLIGVPTIAVAGADIGLTTSGGALIMGLVFGWLRAKTPTFGQFPPAANWMLSTGGLCMFVGIVGIMAGPDFVSGVREEGLSLVFAGLVVTLLPMLLTMFLGKWLFKIPVPVNLGITAGANTTTASIGAITDTAKSQIPVLGYTIPYAIGNVLLTIWGAVIVAVLA